MTKLTHNGEKLIIKKAQYQNGNTAIIIETTHGESYAVATINTDEILPENQAYIKNYSGGEEILELLSANNIVIKQIGSKQSGYVTLPLFEINLDKLD